MSFFSLSVNCSSPKSPRTYEKRSDIGIVLMFALTTLNCICELMRPLGLGLCNLTMSRGRKPWQRQKRYLITVKFKWLRYQIIIPAGKPCCLKTKSVFSDLFYEIQNIRNFEMSNTVQINISLHNTVSQKKERGRQNRQQKYVYDGKCKSICELF